MVLFKTRPDLSPERFDRILTEARTRLVQIPGVSHLRVGKPLLADAEWAICLSMEFEDEKALQAYRVHPIHVAYIKENLDGQVTHRLALDYWME
jgi:hypothetical protein